MGTSGDRYPLEVNIDPMGCWIPNRKPNMALGGYVYIRTGGETKARLHILTYETFIGPVPDGHDLHHRCENPPCCNPWHLEPLTKSGHMQRHRAGLTHCKRGHELNAENIRKVNNGRRQCRLCWNDRRRINRRERGRND